MKRVAQVIGIDPGLVHTGCVRMLFDADKRSVTVEHEVINGVDVVAVQAWVGDDPGRLHIYIEDYRPRHNLAPDQRMVSAVAGLKHGLPGSHVLPNTGVKKVVPPHLMRLLEVHDWPQATHHQDLRSAARIALLGMMKDPSLNPLLATTVKDHLAGNTWKVERP